jgi:predicted GIY-YIG superfamily endonuclease
MPQLYRHYDAQGGLLYIGISSEVLRRLGEHRQSRWYRSIALITIEPFPTWKAAQAAERAAIRAEWPRYNAETRGRPEQPTREVGCAELQTLAIMTRRAADLRDEIRDLRARLDATSEERRRLSAQVIARAQMKRGHADERVNFCLIDDLPPTDRRSDHPTSERRPWWRRIL